jgi:pectate lyase
MMQNPKLAMFVGAMLLMTTSAHAQLVSFPGAEGAGRLATGGRGGDVYIVTTLADYDPDNDANHPTDGVEPAIVGSLRHGILTAPAAGRTIVFAVGGTIELHDRLQLSNRTKITIAGQTAPGGGITVAGHEFNVNNSNNIVVQHLRFRAGDKFLTGAPSDRYQPQDYNPDVIGVTGSNTVILDHITASWGVDETVSVTSSSNNVTVQWSTMTQGLYNAGHSDEDGIGHSYGSLLNGGNYSFHHNLYAHSKSRHPRAQKSGALDMQLDWVNNVIYNPGDEFGNSDSDDPYSVNMVGNYGVKGPQSSSGNNFMMDADDLDSKFYVDGNYMDIDRDLVLDGAPVNGTAVFQTGNDFTIVGSRFGLPQVTTHTAEQAYIQVLSRAGANRFRDTIDKRITRSVMNNLPGQILTQNDWGGYPTIPGGTAPPDSNSDGVPDQWATDNGFNSSTPLHQTFAPDGYSYLEKYIHSLTPNAYAPVGTVSHTVRTSFGSGADAFVTENGGAGATSGGNGTGGTLDTAFVNGLNQALVMRFDLSEIVPGSLTSARLDLTAASAINGTRDFMVYALEQDNAAWNWNEATVQFAGAPGLSFDSNSGTLGINNSFTSTSHPENPGVLTLGQVTLTTNVAAGETVSLTNPNLAAFLNLAAYYQDAASADVVTLILQQINNAPVASFLSKEGDAQLAPRLVVDALLAEVIEPPLAGDYNDDGTVDAADYTVWRDAITSGAELLNETESLGIVDTDDYAAWKANFGAVGGSGGGANASVPEPHLGILLLVACALAPLRGVRFVPTRFTQL